LAIGPRPVGRRWASDFPFYRRIFTINVRWLLVGAVLALMMSKTRFGFGFDRRPTVYCCVRGLGCNDDGLVAATALVAHEVRRLRTRYERAR
jgi:hypothetical protein